MGLQLKGNNGGSAPKQPQKNSSFDVGIEETPQMRELRMKREAAAAEAKQALEQQKEAQRLKALAYEQRDAARKAREEGRSVTPGEGTINNDSQLSDDRNERLAAAKAEDAKRAKFRAEEEAKIEAERRVQEKKMDQTEALIAAIRAQVEKEKAAKEEADKKSGVASSAPKSSSSSKDKPQFRTISPEEMAKLEEKKRMKAAGIQPQEENSEPEAVSKPAEKPQNNGVTGGVSGGPSLSNPTGSGPTLTNPTAGQQSLGGTGTSGGGLGINLGGGDSSAPGPDESTVTLDVNAINTAAGSGVKPAPSKPHTPVQVVGEASTIVVDEGNLSWNTGNSESDGVGWVESDVKPQHVKNPEAKAGASKNSLVDENGDIVSVIPVKQKPVGENDVQSAYNIDFDDVDDDDDMSSFSSSSASNSGEDARRKAEEEARKHVEEETRRRNEEAARKRAEQEAKNNDDDARKRAEEEARKKAEEEARKRAEEEARKKAEEEARKRAEEEARKKAEEEARKRAEEEARKRAEEEAKKKAEEEARIRAEEEARKKAEEEARKKAEEEARKRAEEEARKKAEEEARKRAEEEARKKAEEEARIRAEEEARKKAEEEARIRAEEEARKRAEEEARIRAEEEARKKAEEEARKRAEEEARKRAEEEARARAEEEARKKAEEEARIRAEEEARKRAEEEARIRAEEEARKRAEEEARVRAEEEARKRAEEEARQRAEEEAKKRAEEEIRKRAEEEARRKIEEEARRKVEEEARRKVEEEAARAAASQSSGYSLPVGAEQYLGKYLSVASISDQIVNAIKYISDNPSEPRNIVILGQYGFGTTSIAEDFARSFHAMGICKTKTIAKIKAGALNRANISDAISKLQGGCLVVENAGVITNEKLGELYELVSDSSNDVVVIMTGQIDTLSRIFKDNVVISSQFKHLIQVNRITDLDVLEIAKNHATGSGYPCDSGAESNLRKRMQEVESGNLDRVLKFVDNAVSKAHNREMGTGEQDHHLVAADFE